MSYLYVNQQGATIGFSQNCFTVQEKNGLLRKIPCETLDGITIFGSVQISAHCIGECLKRGIGINYFSSKGAYFGRIDSTNHVNTFRQKQQVKLSENPEFTLAFAQSVLASKVYNQITVVRRYSRSTSIEVKKELDQMLNSYKKISESRSIEEAMGYEGIAAKNYLNP